MADISVIKMPDNSSYNIKDAAARESIAALPTDVQVNGMSVVSNNVANIPIASSNELGAVKLDSSGTYGTTYIQNGDVITYIIGIAKATNNEIKASNGAFKPIVPSIQHRSVFYGLAKAAGDSTQSASNNAVGTYTDSAKGAIQKMLGIYNLLSTEETTTATTAHVQNSLFLMNGKLHKATAAIGIGDAVEAGTNCTVVKADEVFVKNTDFANTLSAGIFKMDSSDYGLQMSGNNTLRTKKATDSNIKNGGNSFQPIVPANQHTSVYYALAKLAGEDMATSSGETVGVYSGEQKQAIQTMLGAQAAIEVIRL